MNWTGEVAKHEPIIRDPVLHERWAKENGLKLAEISADKEAFLSWYRAHSPTPTRPAPNDFLDVAFPGARTAIADNALCAEVRFVINFTDGSRVWLADCPRRDPLLTPGEQSHGNWLNALFPSATGQNLPAPQPPPATKTHEPANSTVSAPATRASNAACDPFPFKKVCSELGCKPATLPSLS